MNKTTFLIFSLLITALASCTSQPDYLEEALRAAGDNRAELEKVLKHYRQHESDSLKLKAAIFLIENMPGHRSLGGPHIGEYYKEMDSVLSNRSLPDHNKRIQEVALKYDSLLIEEEDIKMMRADYLIANIDSAFSAWQKRPWTEHVDFEEFCEYILPYKSAELQPMEDWRAYFYNKYEGIKHITDLCPKYQYSSFWMCELYNKGLDELPIGLGALEMAVPLLHPSLLVKLPTGTCDDYALIGVNVMRAKGLPVTFDFTPQWPFQAQGHSWNTLLANNGKHVVFTGTESAPGIAHKPGDRMAKVFRRTYVINRELKKLNEEEEYIPETFRTTFIKDVTKDYMETDNVEVQPLPELKQDEKYAYIAVFNNKDWIPIHWAKVDKDGKALFTQLGREVVYLPVYYTKEGIKPMAYPFLLDSQGNVKWMKADTTQTQVLRLERKYPLSINAAFMGSRILGGKFQVSNNKDFRDSLTVHEISKYHYSGKVTELPDSAWRYWRYLSSRGGLVNMAEVVFYEKETMQPVKGEIIGTDGSSYGDTTRTKKAMFDGDPLTYFDAPTWDGSWAGMDFGKKVKMGQIIYIPRSDGNIIQLNDTYKLFWWDTDGWKQLGEDIVAKDIILEYTGAPTNALFLLRDISRGKEERIFTYSNGKQRFW